MFDPNADLHKQNAKSNIAFIGRVVHENINGWTTHIGRYFGTMGFLQYSLLFEFKCEWSYLVIRPFL